ncbi:MAG TPA: hypothetical protein VGC42_17060 [Kofleriaceae bacterium]
MTLALVLCVAACGVGGGDDKPPDDTTPLCTATLTVSGTFTVASGAVLDSTAGCQPDGTWTINAATASKGSCSAVPVKAMYAYTIAGTGRDTSTTYATGAGEDFTGAVEATGTGNCEGSFDHIVKNGNNYDEFNFHPELAKATDGATSLAITGEGTYNQWSAHP